MFEINLKGPYYNMGLQYGKGMKKTGFKLPMFPDKRLKLGQMCKDHVEVFFPEILEEIRGISDATELDYDGLCTMVLTHPQAVPKCSVFAVTDGQQTFIGRNYDMFYSLKNLTESYFTEPNGSFKSVGQTDIYIGREDGVNERGLGVAMSGITAYFEPGIAFWIAIRYILDKCGTVQEAIDFLTEIPHHCTISF
ncbi:MAG: C45 family autoproteolytic acyltransferase/hydrolase, partial [Candidatus Hodarchaeota archaeon]